VSLIQGQIDILQRTLDHRKPLIDPRHRSALRLLNGFYEGIPDLLVDLYGSTLVLSKREFPQILKHAVEASYMAINLKSQSLKTTSTTLSTSE